MTKERRFLIDLLDKNGFALFLDGGKYSANSYSGSSGFELAEASASDNELVGAFVIALGSELII